MRAAPLWSSPAIATDANAQSVLIVDDDVDILAALAELLESQGYQVTMVTDARDFVQHLRSRCSYTRLFVQRSPRVAAGLRDFPDGSTFPSRRGR